MYTNRSDVARERHVGVLAAVAIAQLMVSLDVSVVNVALPTIQASLAFSLSALSWVVNAYALFFGGLLLLGGRTADRFGRRPIFQVGLLLFGVTSLAGGLVRHSWELIVARAAQGVGAALIAPCALAVLSTTFPSGRERARAFAVYSAVTAGGAAAGVIIGGLLTEYVGWRWVMLLNVPITVIGLFLVRRYVPVADATDKAHKLDVVGAVLATAGTMLLVYGLVRADGGSLGSPRIYGPLVGAVVLLAAFIFFEGRVSREPLLRLGLLGNRSVAASNIIMMIISITMFAGFYFLSLYLQHVLGLSALPAGLAFLPFCVGLVAGSLFAPLLVRRLGARMLLIVGTIIAAIGMLWLGLGLSATGTFASVVLWPTVVASIGLGSLLVPLAATATAGVPPHEAGMASGVLNSARQLGGSIGLAAMSTIAATVTAHSMASDSAATRLANGYGAVYVVDSALLVVALLIAVFMLRRGGRPDRSGGAGSARAMPAGDVAGAGQSNDSRVNVAP